ncbi:MAG: ROK family protein [Phycisphaerales bacterium]
MNALTTESSRRIVRLIRQHRHVPTTQLVKMTGLTLACVAKTVNDLVDAGTIREAGELRLKRRGRPSQTYKLQRNGGYALGLAVKHHQIEFILIDLLHNVVAESTLPNRLREPGQSAAAVERIAAEADRLITDSVRPKLTGVSVALVGLFDDQLHRPATASDLADKGQIDALGAALDARLHVPVHFVNDIDASIIAERWALADVPNPGSIIYINELLGFSILVDGRISMASLFGSNRWLGRAPVRRDARPLPPEFAGCLVTTASMGGICDQLERVRFGTRPDLAHRSVEQWQSETRRLFDRFDSGDPEVRRIVRHAFEDLGFVVRTLCILFGIRGVILEGWNQPMRDMGVDIVQQTLNEAGYEGVDGQRSPPKVRPNSFGVRQQVLGAAIAAIEQKLGSPMFSRSQHNRTQRTNSEHSSPQPQPLDGIPTATNTLN